MSKKFKTLNLLPFHVVDRNHEPIDGMGVGLQEFCKKKFKTDCENFYKTISTEGYHMCPYGFAIRSFGHDGRMCFFTGLNVREIADVKKLRQGNRLPAQQLEVSFVDGVLEQYFQFQNIRDEFGEMKREKQIHADTIHEVRNYNAQIKAACESHSFENGEILPRKAEGIILNNLALSQMITSRLEYQVFLVNPTQALKEKIKFYKKVDKAVKSIRAEAATRGITIDSRGSSFTDIEAFSFVDQIPAVLIQNAVKYGLPQTAVSVEIKESFSNVILSVTNTGPYIHEDEREKIFQKGYRGREGRATVSGTGTGLWFLKKILEIHRATIEVSVGEPRVWGNQNVSLIKFEIKIPFS